MSAKNVREYMNIPRKLTTSDFKKAVEGKNTNKLIGLYIK